MPDVPIEDTMSAIALRTSGLDECRPSTSLTESPTTRSRPRQPKPCRRAHVLDGSCREYGSDVLLSFVARHGTPVPSVNCAACSSAGAWSERAMLTPGC